MKLLCRPSERSEYFINGFTCKESHMKGQARQANDFFHILNKNVEMSVVLDLVE